jgi:hypothetical protein
LIVAVLPVPTVRISPSIRAAVIGFPPLTCTDPLDSMIEAVTTFSVGL